MAENKSKYIGNYEILQTLGEGSFAKVKLGIHRLTNQKVAVKIIDKTRLPDDYAVKNLHREAQIMRQLDHPHVIQMFEVMETKKNLFLILEYAPKGELLDYIVSKGRLSEKEAKKFIVQILAALDHIHSKNVVHRDLKSENILLDENNNVKLSDFGLSNVYDPLGTLETCCGSPVYSAPELIEGKRYTGPEIDAWSFGINVYAMVVGDLPFADANVTALYKSILSGKYDVPDYLSSDCKDFISKLLMVNPKKRWTIKQMLKHPWIAKTHLPKVPHTARPTSAKDLDANVMEQLTGMGFDEELATTSILNGKFNQAGGTYYLLMYQKHNGEAHESKESVEQSPKTVKKEHHSPLPTTPEEQEEPIIDATPTTKKGFYTVKRHREKKKTMLPPIKQRIANEPRNIRATNNCLLVTMMDPDEFLEKVIFVLKHNDVDYKSDGYSMTAEWGDIGLELEVVKAGQRTGIRIKRTFGDTWDYKGLTKQIVLDLEELVTSV